MIAFRNVTLRRGPRALFSNASFTLYPSEKVGLVGPNGAGKTSLFSLLQGTLTPDLGDISIQAGHTLASVAQDVISPSRTTIEFVLDGDRKLRDIQAAICIAEKSNNGALLGTLHAGLAAIDGYAAPSRAARLLAGLGFSTKDIERPISEYSGGWQRRLALAQALMSRSDILLLDEPTNHLDLDAVLWLEDWIKAYPGLLIVIAHDRDFLDRVVSRIISIQKERVESYTGNYSDFESQRALRISQQQEAFSKQQRHIQHITDFVQRFKAKASKARQAQSRLRSLERIERVLPAHSDSPFSFSFMSPAKLPKPLLALDDAAFGYPQKVILNGVSVSISPGDRIGLLGRNGAGKSTLTRSLAGMQQLLAGELTCAQDLNIGYFAQHSMEQLVADLSPIDHVRRLGGSTLHAAGEEEQRSFLGSFGFSQDRVFQPVGPFSGGEKARLILALLISQQPNLLLLDEPTNHLDLEMRHALGMALQEYAGALILVSHDRYLLRLVADQLWLVADGAVSPFDGDLDDYASWLKNTHSEITTNGPVVIAKRDDPRERKRTDAERRKRLSPLKAEIAMHEKSLNSVTTEIERIGAQLADPALYEASQRASLAALVARDGSLRRQLAEIEDAWLEASERLSSASEDG